MQEFLKELSALTRKYELYISGCNCCGSPWIEDVEGEAIGDNLKWEINKQKYIIDLHSDF